MRIETTQASPLACPQCGKRSVGRFCSHCGSPLTPGEESVASEIRSKITTPITSLLSFCKTMWLVLVSPRAFYTSYVTGSPPLTDLDFPFSGLWRGLFTAPQKTMRPFQSLAAGIGLAGAIATMQSWSWRMTGFSERAFGMSMAELAEKSERNLRAFYETQYGRPLTVIDTAHLSGISFVDGPAHEIIALLQYTYFPIVVSIFLAGVAFRRAILMHFYVYAVSASLAVFFLCGLASVALFLLLQGGSAQAALGVSSLPTLVGHAARVYLIAVLPVVVFPHVLPVTRGRMVMATVAGALVWMTINWFVTQFLVFRLGVVWH